jgi:hypothetical protein
MICGDGHAARRCPALWDPLNEGFYSGGGGGGGHSHDDDDERAAKKLMTVFAQWLGAGRINPSNDENGLPHLLQRDQRINGSLYSWLRA